ncbi:hypothetical protein NKH28_15210 [Mesorhizobium sp. M1227]|uniref:hypothetical protein n=1 Tax=Mesorhizobium sp. M1227 TaxID=2957071 RepID=UPI00333D91D0
MVEIKPADAATMRFAIRAAIGQLLDYRQHQRWTGRQVILVGAKVTSKNDLSLAFDNGFGLGLAHWNRRIRDPLARRRWLIGKQAPNVRRLKLRVAMDRHCCFRCRTQSLMWGYRSPPNDAQVGSNGPSCFAIVQSVLTRRRAEL